MNIENNTEKLTRVEGNDLFKEALDAVALAIYGEQLS